MALLREAHPGMTLDVVGDGPDRPALERMCEALGLGGAVHFHGMGTADQVAEAMRGADLLVLPSHVENAPVVLIEAGASGLPVVATAVGGVPEIVQDSWGQVVPVAQPAALASAIERMLAREGRIAPPSRRRSSPATAWSPWARAGARSTKRSSASAADCPPGAASTR